jgi:hypothetical protein
MTEIDDNERAADDDLRPIPDGGLASTLPDWLKEKPAWAQRSEAGNIPPPDTSPIDPRTLVHDEDFPEWLRAIAQRGRAPETVLPEIEPLKDTDASVEEAAHSPVKSSSPGSRVPITTWVASPPMASTVTPAWDEPPLGEPVVPGLDTDIALRRWIESGENIDPDRPRWRDPVLLGFIAAAILIVIVTAVLLTL